MKITIEILLLIAGLFVLLEGSLGHYHSAYEHSDELEKHSPVGWMKDIDGNTEMRQLSLPGTHESLARWGTYIAICQRSPLLKSLLAGIRALDIRCRHQNDKFPIHHGPAFQGIYFTDVLDIAVAFLKQYDTEAIFMRVSEDTFDISIHKGNDKTFEEVFKKHIAPHKNFIYDPNTQDTSLRAMRGKIVFLTDHEEIVKYGFKLNSFDTQDSYDLSKFEGSNVDIMYAKWEKVKGHLNSANKDQGSEKWFVNYLSGTSSNLNHLLIQHIYPYFVASGHNEPGTHDFRRSTFVRGPKSCSSRTKYIDYPREDCDDESCTIMYEGTNILAYEYIRIARIKYTGLVYADFPGKGLIDRIISLNFKNNEKSRTLKAKNSKA